MNCLNLTTLVSSKSCLSSTSLLSFHSSTNPFQLPRSSSRFSHVTPIHCGLRELRNRINSVKNTQKITEAMKLVSAAKVRRAQEAVVNDGDEFFRLTTKEGKLAVERDVLRTETAELSPILQFEQDPVQILDALLPLYMNSQILKALQESLASELAARMCAMTNATDNAVELKKSLSIIYNRERQAKITGELLEIIAGADALT